MTIKQNPFKLLVFDWDGTLMDSEAQIVATVKAAAADLDLPILAASQIRDIIGLGLYEALNRLYPDHLEFHERLIERYRHYYLASTTVRSLPFTGGIETLADLHRQGYLMAIATGKGRRGLDAVLDETGYRGLFHATRCADECHSKPHPQMLLEIMELLNVTAADTLMIGDSEYDMHMARNAGTAALAVTYGVHTLERLLDCGPLGCLDAITDLPAWLKRCAATVDS